MDPRHLFIDERHTGFCVYCGAQPDTRDHVPSKVFLKEKRDVRAEIALHISSFIRFNTYAKISTVRCARDFAPCHGPGYRTKRDIF